MEVRGNVKRIGNGTTDVTVRDNVKKVKVVEVPQTRAEKAKGFLSELSKVFQGFADWAATTKAGSQEMDDVFGLPKMSSNENMIGIPDSPKQNRKPRRK